MKQKIEEIQSQALTALSQISDTAALTAFEVQVLGKKGELTLLLRETGKLPEAERPAFGAAVNAAKLAIQARIDESRAALSKGELEARLKKEALDTSLPGRERRAGTLHPLAQMEAELCGIFRALGFNVETGPELEDAFHNFDALNVPEDHPSRDSHDTFYLGEKLLRTHTSPVQIRVLKSRKPPIRIVAPGRVFRRDAQDATHAPQFHQFEGLAVDEFGKVRLSDLKGVLEHFIHRLFGKGLKARFRPSYFPFTEPSLEVDTQCFQCQGKGCGLCKQSGWIELGGASTLR